MSICIFIICPWEPYTIWWRISSTYHIHWKQIIPHHIVACQRGGVSNEPLGQRQDTGPGILWSVHWWTRPTGKPPTCGVKQPHIWFALFTKAGWALHVTIYIKAVILPISFYTMFSLGVSEILTSWVNFHDPHPIQDPGFWTIGYYYYYTPHLWRDECNSFVCLCLLRLHYAPLQRYMGYLCTIRVQYAPPRRNMHHGTQGRLCF